MIDELAFSPLPVMQFLDDGGHPLVGGFLCTFAAGTDTPLPTTDYDGKENPTEIVLDSRGETPVSVLLDVAKSYKFRLLRPDRSMVWERDGIRASGIVFGDSQVSGLSAESPITMRVSGTELVIGFDSSEFDSRLGDLAESIADEAEERKEADSALAGSIKEEAAAREAADSAEAEARKDADDKLRAAIEGKQDRLTAGDNILIDGLNRISVTGRLELFVTAPLSARRDGNALILSCSVDPGQIEDAIAAERAERKAADEALAESVTEEAAERETADEALRAAIDEQGGIISGLGTDVAGLVRDLGQEIGFRRQGDEELLGSIAAEAAERGAQDALIRQDIRKLGDWSLADIPAASGESVPLFDIGPFTLKYYSDNAASPRFTVCSNDGATYPTVLFHYKDTSGYDRATTLLNVGPGSDNVTSVGFTTTYCFQRMSFIPCTSGVSVDSIHEAEIFYVPMTANGKFIWRVLKTQTFTEA